MNNNERQTKESLHTLKSRSPVSSQASPIKVKVCPLIHPNKIQMRQEGINPVPVAIPADKVKMPAPATLLTKLNTDDGMEALVDSSTAALKFFVVLVTVIRVFMFLLLLLLLAAAPPRGNRIVDSFDSRSLDWKRCSCSCCCCCPAVCCKDGCFE